MGTSSSGAAFWNDQCTCYIPFGHEQVKLTHFTDDGKLHAGPRLSDFVLVFADDTPVFSKSATEHEQHLRTVSELLRKENLQIKASKCV